MSKQTAETLSIGSHKYLCGFEYYLCFAVGECKIDLVIVLDDSGSICDNDPVNPSARPCGNWRLTLEFAKGVVNQFNVDDGRTRVGLIMFSSSARDIWYLDS